MTQLIKALKSTESRAHLQSRMNVLHESRLYFDEKIILKLSI